MANKKIPRVGFDLDGVLLYNPARITRPIISFIKKNVFGRKTDHFYLPQSKIEQWFWCMFHKSSIFPASGIDEIKRLVKEKKIKAYIITARYSFLKDDFEKWLKKIKADQYFQGCYYNKNDEQPHIFKEKMIKKLKLDIFVEDNWDIVKHLKTKNEKLCPPPNRMARLPKRQVKIFWVYNIFDRKIKYKYKSPSLISVLKKIRNNK